VIVVNDGSTDNTAQVLAQIKDPRLKIKTLSQNQGKGGAVAQGVRQARFKTIFLCDADLRGLKPEHIEKMVQVFLKHQKQVMVVGLCEKRWSSITHHLRRSILPLISGQRIVSKKILLAVTRSPLAQEWGLEASLNHYCRRHRIKIVKLLLKGVNDYPKWHKGHGYRRALEELFQLIAKYWLIYCWTPLKNLLPHSAPLRAAARKGKFREKQVKINGVKINFAFGGQGQQSLIFIHGWTNNWQGWLPLCQRLRKDYRLYLIDLPGFGDSGNLKTYTIPKAARYVAQLIEQEKIKQPIVIGLSMGSLVAAWLGKSQPQKIKKVVLISPPFKLGRRRLVARSLEKILQSINGKNSIESAVKKAIEARLSTYLLAKYINMHRFNRFLVDTYGMIGKKKMRKEAFVQMGISVAQFDLAKVLENYPIPVIIIAGREDKIIPIKALKQLLITLPGQLPILHVVPQAGHVVPWEKPQQVARIIRQHC